MPCNDTGLIRPEVLSNFKTVSVDWSNGKRGPQGWVSTPLPMDAETPLVRQAEILAAANPGQRVFTYLNLVIAYPWFPTIREKLTDPAYSGWFIRFNPTPPNNGSYYSPPCDNNFNPPLCTDFFHSQDQTPGFPHGDGDCPGPCDCGGVPCGFYLFNHANETLCKWLLDDVVFGPNALGHPSKAIQGVYLDDNWQDFYNPIDAPDCAANPIGGPTEVNSHCIQDTGLTQADTTANTLGWRSMMLELQARMQATQTFSWAFFTEISWGAPATPHMCKAFFTNNGTDYYDRALMMGMKVVNRTQDTVMRDLVTFLLIRGPYAYIGDPWQGCNSEGPSPLPPEVLLDYGVPLGNITLVGDDTFTREWSNATVSFNCTAYEASVAWR